MQVKALPKLVLYEKYGNQRVVLRRNIALSFTLCYICYSPTLLLAIVFIWHSRQYFNHSPAIMLVIDRAMHRSSNRRYKVCTYLLSPTRVKTTTNTIIIISYMYDNLSAVLTLYPLFYAQTVIQYVAILLLFTSVYRQKKSHVTCHVKFVAICCNFTIV